MKVTSMQLQRGISKYFDREIVSGMEGLSKWVVGAMGGMIASKVDHIVDSFKDNEFVRMLDIIDSNGHIDIDLLHTAIKEQARNSPAMLNIPMIGSIKFTEGDVDRLVEYIKES